MRNMDKVILMMPLKIKLTKKTMKTMMVKIKKKMIMDYHAD